MTKNKAKAAAEAAEKLRESAQRAMEAARKATTAQDFITATEDVSTHARRAAGCVVDAHKNAITEEDQMWTRRAAAEAAVAVKLAEMTIEALTIAGPEFIKNSKNRMH